MYWTPGYDWNDTTENGKQLIPKKNIAATLPFAKGNVDKQRGKWCFADIWA